MFALYSYVAKAVTEVGGLPDGAVPVFLLAFGLGMVAGTYVAGALADWSVFRLPARLLARDGRAAPVVAALAPPAGGVAPAVPGRGLVLGARGQPPAPPDGVAGDAQTLGAAMNHSSLNIGNALGAGSAA